MLVWTHIWNWVLLERGTDQFVVWTGLHTGSIYIYHSCASVRMLCTTLDAADDKRMLDKSCVKYSEVALGCLIALGGSSKHITLASSTGGVQVNWSEACEISLNCMECLFSVSISFVLHLHGTEIAAFVHH